MLTFQRVPIGNPLVRIRSYRLDSTRQVSSTMSPVKTMCTNTTQQTSKRAWERKGWNDERIIMNNIAIIVIMTIIIQTIVHTTVIIIDKKNCMSSSVVRGQSTAVVPVPNPCTVAYPLLIYCCCITMSCWSISVVVSWWQDRACISLGWGISTDTGYVCVFFTLNRSFYSSTPSTPSVRADSSS